MPQYYTGADPTQAFSAGMMAGYDFVDRIKARNEQVRLAKLQEQRDTERLGMQKEQFQLSQEAGRFGLERARTTATQQDTVFQQQQTRRPIVEAQQDVLYSADVEAKGLQAAAARAGLDAIREGKEGRAASDQFLRSVYGQSGGADPLTLGGVGVQGTQSAQDVEPAVGAASVQPRAAAGVPTPGSSGGTAAVDKPLPYDLRAAQQVVGAEPTPLDRVADAVSSAAKQVVEFPKKVRANDFWGVVGNPEVRSKSFEASAAKVRSDPPKYFDNWMEDRGRITDNRTRSRIDATMEGALVEQRDAAIREMDLTSRTSLANPRAATAKIRALANTRAEAEQRLESLYKAKAETAAASADITTPTIAGNDPKALAAVTTAGKQQQAAGIVPTMTQQELESDFRRLGSIQNPAKLTRQQLNWLSESFRKGTINEQTYSNWLRFGGPVAPAPPKFIPFGNGTGIVQFGDGRFAQLDLGGAGKSKAGGGGDFKEASHALAFAANFFEGAGKIGDFEGKDIKGQFHVGQMIELMRSKATLFQQRNPEMEILDDEGEFTGAWMQDPLQLLKGMRYYIDLQNGVEDPGDTSIPIANQENAEQLIPQTPLVQR